MTAEQAERIVGAPPGWYDGVGGISTNAPVIKDTWWRDGPVPVAPSILEPDGRGRVKKATFYPALWVERSLWHLIIERLTRSTVEQWERWWMYGTRLTWVAVS